MNGDFSVEISVHNNEVNGKIFDKEFGDEYTNFRQELNTGDFVGQVRDSYTEVLEDIKNNCCEVQYYLFDQTNRISLLIKEKYGDNPEFLWDKYPGFGTYRNPLTRKWYGLIMNVAGEKIGADYKTAEIINVKVNPDDIPDLLKKEGIYPAYHMSKKSWVSVILDDTLKDEEIMEYIETSHKFSMKK